MEVILKQIHERRHSIDREIKDLEMEKRLWSSAGILNFHGHLLTDKDVVNRRTAHKFAVLGEVAKFLAKDPKLRQRGATASKIYEQIAPKVPMLSASTFRSHLTRFKSEGRLLYDEKKGTWNLTQRRETTT